MKKLVYFALVVVLNTTCFAQNNQDNCTENIDTIYDRRVVLDYICLNLNKLNFYYSIYFMGNYNVQDQNFYNFFIYDLVDTLNVYPNYTETCIEFKDKHIYHIASVDKYLSISMILILDKGKLVFFRGLNCEYKINRIEDIFRWLEYQQEIKYEVEVVRRIKNFSKYNISYAVDPIGRFATCACGKVASPAVLYNFIGKFVESLKFKNVVIYAYIRKAFYRPLIVYL